MERQATEIKLQEKSRQLVVAFADGSRFELPFERQHVFVVGWPPKLNEDAAERFINGKIIRHLLVDAVTSTATGEASAST